MSSKPTVFVSGASGYIALHVVNELLSAGYKVIGSTRSDKKAAEVEKKFGNNPNLKTVIVPDIAEPGAFDHAFEEYGSEIKVVLHVASPFFFDTTEYEKDLLLPAVNGTKSILESVKKYAPQTVENVVVTSSLAAIVSPKRMAEPNALVTEKDWNDTTWEGAGADPVTAYCASKKFAEEAAWKFLEENKSIVKFRLITVNPGYVFGPQLSSDSVGDVLNTSCELINSIVHSKPGSEIQPISGPYIDVRDVAKAHLLAFEKEETFGKRLMLVEGAFSLQQVADIINEEFPQLKGNVATGEPGTGEELLNKSARYDPSKTKAILGFKLRNLKETVYDTVDQILKVEGRA